MIAFVLYVVVVAFTFFIVNLFIFKKLPKFKTFTLFGLLLLLGIILSPLYYELPSPPDSKIITFENGKTIFHPYGLIVWEWKEKYYNLPVRNPNLQIQSNVEPITANPKLLHLKYTVKIKIERPEIFLLEPSRQQRIKQRSTSALQSYAIALEANDLTNYWIKEINYRHSNDLSAFYNDLDDGQQKQFKELIESLLNPHLEPVGLKVECDGFRLE